MCHEHMNNESRSLPFTEIFFLQDYHRRNVPYDCAFDLDHNNQQNVVKFLCKLLLNPIKTVLFYFYHLKITTKHLYKGKIFYILTKMQEETGNTKKSIRYTYNLK